jgi:hypothetical protein
VVERHLVNLFHDFSAFIASVWKDKFKADRFAEALADEVEKKLDPAHKPRKETFALGMNLVDEIIKRLLMPLD